jgi:peptidyl-prolyl cis-trans isomerase D
MAALETIRTKAGALISIIIGLALLAFIVNPDTIGTARNIFSSRNDVAKIGGHTISYEEFSSAIDRNTNINKLMYWLLAGQEAPSGEQASENMRELAWNDMIKKYVLEPEYAKAGLSVSDEELTDLMTGENLSPVVKSFFADPQTGLVNRNIIANILQQVEVSNEWKVFWISMEDQVRDQQLVTRMSELSSKSDYSNSLDVNRMVESSKTNFEFGYVLKDYNSVPDSLIVVANSDLKKYYEAHKYEYKQARARDMEYIVFNITPSANDFERTRNIVERIAEQMATKEVSELSSFVTLNSEKPFDDKYYKRGEFPQEIDSLVSKGKTGDMFPYYQIGDTYYVSRISNMRMLPDSVKAQHILLNTANITSKEAADSIVKLADSIIKRLEGGAKFAEFAQEFSSDKGANLQGGDLGWFSFSQMVRPFSDSCFYGKKGKYMKVGTQFGLHIVQVTDTKNISEKIQLATVQETATPGRETYSQFHNRANSIVTAADGTLAGFRKAAQEAGVQTLKEYNVQLGVKKIASLSEIGELVRWLYDAEEGDVSGVIEVNDKSASVVAALTRIKPAGIAPFEQVRADVEVKTRREKKAAKLNDDLTKALEGAATIDEVASKTGGRAVSVSSPVNFTVPYISGLMLPEPKLVGAVTATKETNKLSKPVVGENGVFVYTVTNIAANPQAITEEMARMRLTSAATGQASFYPALMDKAKVEDNRGRFF